MSTPTWCQAIEDAGIDLDHDNAEWQIVPIIVETIMADADALLSWLDDCYPDYQRNLAEAIALINNGNSSDIAGIVTNITEILSVVRRRIREYVEHNRGELLADAITHRKERLLGNHIDQQVDALRGMG